MPRYLLPYFLPIALFVPSGCGDTNKSAQDAGIADALGGQLDATPQVPDAGPTICADQCELDILPRVVHLPLALDGANRALALVGIRDEGAGEPPLLLHEQATWRSLDPSVVTVDDTGRVTAVARGQTWIELRYDDQVAFADVSVSGLVTERSLAPGPAARDYLLFVPDSYSGSSSPLVLNFHGGFGSGANQMDMSQMNRSAAKNGFLVAYPDGLGAIPTWNAGACCGSSAQAEVDDVGFARDVVADIADDYAVDNKRVYATGFSNGAMLTHRLGCEAADIFAAIAPVGGGLNVGGDFPSCQPERAVPLLMMHGTGDRNYPIQGGVGDGFSGQDFYSIGNTLVDWASLNNTSLATGTAVINNFGTLCLEYTGDVDIWNCNIFDPVAPTSDADVVYDGSGHAYPGGARGPSATSDLPMSLTYLDGAETIWQFFQEHPMP